MAQAGPDAEQALTAAHQALLRRRDIQFDFPAAMPPVRKPPPGWLEPLLRFLSELSPVLLWIFVAGLALGAALLLFFLLRELLYSRLPKRKARASAAEEPDWRPSEATARTLLEDADRLAAEGRFEEAVHLLLFRSIEDIAQRKPGLVRPALTSRDLARAEALPPPARGAFAAIAAAVERSFFGGRPVDAAGFADCRRAYQDFALPGAWR